MKLSSNNKKIIVFSDVHQDIAAVESILKREKDADFFVCLGDWFDSFIFNKRVDIIRTCDFLIKWIDDPRFITLYGNHEFNGLFNNSAAFCSGYTKERSDIINDSLGKNKQNIVNKFRWHIFIDDWLCTHAGLSVNHIPPMLELTQDSIDQWLTNEGEKATTALKTNDEHWFYAAGRARGGFSRCGGIVWQDFDQEFVAIDGLKQLCGHTPHFSICAPDTYGGTDLTESENLDIDCYLVQYLVIENGKLRIKDNK